MKKELTLGRFLELLNYDPLTGLFICKIGRRGIKAGTIAGTWRSDGRVHIKIDGTLYYAHRLAWFVSYGEWPTQQIDHINGVPYDNRLVNLRDVSGSINMRNADHCDSDGHYGVYPHGSGYQVRFRIDGKLKAFGTFPTEEMAIAHAKKIIKDLGLEK